MSLKMRSALVVLVLANLLASAAFALPRASHPAPARAAGVTAAWEWLVGLFTPSASAARTPATGMATKAGSSMDPNGFQNLGNFYPVSTTDVGVHTDPSGRK